MGELPVLVELKQTIADGHAPSSAQALDLFRRMSESIANGEKAFPGGDAPKGDGASSSRSEKLGPAAEKEFAAYIEANVRPALRKALVNVAKSRPSDPLTFLSQELIKLSKSK